MRGNAVRGMLSVGAPLAKFLPLALMMSSASVDPVWPEFAEPAPLLATDHS